ncbi:MAG: hypothetical protein AAGA66_18740 [Bacteroidota bacterium]
MKAGIIILCRFSSSRLPGKILKELNGKPILEHIYDRVALSKKCGSIIIATSDDASDDPIAQFCLDHHYTCYRGSLQNVSERFLHAAVENDLDYAVRINGDNLFCDAGLIDKAVGYAIDEKLDVVSNVPERTYPIGMSVEVVCVSFYKHLIQQFEEEKYKEHVTLYFYEHDITSNFRFLKNEELPEAGGLHLAIDTEDDFRFAAKLMERLTTNFHDNNWMEIAKLALNEK